MEEEDQEAGGGKEKKRSGGGREEGRRGERREREGKALTPKALIIATSREIMGPASSAI